MFANTLRSLTRRVAASSASSSSTAARAFASSSSPIVLPDLPYDYGALEPYVSAEIMHIHHAKHHATYVNNMNATAGALADAVAAGDVAAQIALAPALNFNGGGHVNHSLFWENLAPASQAGGGDPSGALADAIVAKWGSVDAFRTAFAAATVAVQGSGWGWLTHHATNGLQIETRANQDPVVGVSTPLLGVDVWEHAYYLQYQNVRPDYVNAMWNIVNWKTVEQRYAAVLNK